VGCRKTNLSVIGRKSMFFTRDIPFAGYNFSQDLMRRFDISDEEAEQVKIAQGMEPNLPAVGNGGGAGLSLADKGPFERLGDEINRSLRYYVKETGQSYFHSVLLTGGAAQTKGLDAFLKHKFNLPVTIYNPCVALETGGKTIDEGSQLSVAIGLALRAE
jgi:type IV pilus assembly protein PilM